MIGIVEIITLLMGLAGFGVGNNPKAPTADLALEYAMPDADIVTYIDVGALVPGNYKVLVNLPNHPQIKSSPELQKAVRKVIAEVEGPHKLVKGMIGLDLVNDISDATAFLKFVPRRDPHYVVQVHGRFTTKTIEKLAGAAGKPTIAAGRGIWFDAGDDNAVGLTKNGVLIAGTAGLVKDRMQDNWQAPARVAGSTLGDAADVLASRPIFSFQVALSQAARADALKNLPGKNFLTDLIKRHKMGSFNVFRDGIGWTWIDNSRTGLDALATMSEGVVELLRAAQIAPRGVAKILMGGLESYRGTNKHVDALLRRKGDLEKIIASYTGDGQFKAQIDKDPKAMKLAVRLTGKSLSEVVPLGGVVPFAGVFLFLGGAQKDEARTQPMMIPAPPPPRPAKSRRP